MLRAAFSSRSATSPRKPYVVPFHAVIKLFSPVKLLDEARAEIVLNGEKVVLPIASSQREQIKNQLLEPEQIYLARLWFRTTEGIVTNVELAGFNLPREGQAKDTMNDKPLFQIAGRIEVINKEEGSITLKIEPNPTGDLQEAFSAEAWAALELLENLEC